MTRGSDRGPEEPLVPARSEHAEVKVRTSKPGVTGPAGAGIIRAALVLTALFAVVAVAAAVWRSAFSTLAVVLSLVLFTAGCVAFLWAYAVAIGRSRVDAIGMGGLFFLQGTAPRPVQRSLLGALAVQVVVALATAAAHPFTSQAFVILVPMFGLGLAGLWGAKHGAFPPRDEKPPSRPASNTARDP